AFNLYWQSVMMFLLFYYTDSIDVQIGIASASYLIASVWDGLANFGAGMLLEHRQSRIRYGTLISIGGVPLGLSFILMYVPPPAHGLRGALVSLARNRGFVTLNAAMMAVIVAITVLGKSVLYYFKYILGDVGAGQVALALTFAVSAVAIPLWMLLGRAVGLRL